MVLRYTPGKSLQWVTRLYTLIWYWGYDSKAKVVEIGLSSLNGVLEIANTLARFFEGVKITLF